MDESLESEIMDLVANVLGLRRFNKRGMMRIRRMRLLLAVGCESKLRFFGGVDSRNE
jgi:hypothetical protein